MKCERCKYRSHIGGDLRQVICYYIVHTNKRRGCPFGDECTKFEEGRPASFLRQDGQNAYKNRGLG